MKSTMIVLITLMVLTVGYQVNEVSEQNQEILKELREIDHDPVFVSSYYNEGMRGVNFEGLGYFVVTAGKTSEEIFLTECHELSHELINHDAEHFCEGKYND
jgi:hypothetical protein